MPKVTYVQQNGDSETVDAEEGMSLMLAAVQNNIHGIEAECGGCASCATCHVYVREDQLHLLPEMSALENDLLSGVASERKAGSRLGCQVPVSKQIDGLVVHIPPTQT